MNFEKVIRIAAIDLKMQPEDGFILKVSLEPVTHIFNFKYL